MHLACSHRHERHIGKSFKRLLSLHFPFFIFLIPALMICVVIKYHNCFITYFCLRLRLLNKMSFWLNLTVSNRKIFLYIFEGSFLLFHICHPAFNDICSDWMSWLPFYIFSLRTSSDFWQNHSFTYGWTLVFQIGKYL